jgi:glycogen synthase
MRLLLTTDTLGGVWDYSATLSHVLAAEGHAVLLAILGDPTEAQLAALPEEIVIESKPFQLEWMPGAADDLQRTTRWLAELAGAWRTDVVHLNQMAYTAGRPFASPTAVVVHSDVASWFSEVLGSPPPPEWGSYMRVVRAGLAGADRLVTPTRYQGDLVEQHFGRPVTHVIPNGVSAPPGSSEHPKQRLVLSVGRAWDQGKGIATLDRALERLGNRAPPAHLVGATEGPSGQSFTPAHLRREGTLARDQVSRWMSRAALFVGPSLYEPFGLAPLEAAAHGCALVLSDIGSFRELWDGSASFFPPGDAEALAGLIESLMADPGRVRSQAAAAKRRAADLGSVDRFGAAYLELYRGLATRSRQPGRSPPRVAATFGASGEDASCRAGENPGPDRP